MIQILSRLFSDTESLLEYMRFEGCGKTIDYSRICNRLIALARQSDPSKSDSFYDGMGDMCLSHYHNLAEMLSLLALDWEKEGLCMENNTLYVKEEKFEEWSKIIISVSPLWLIACFLAEKVDAGMFQFKYGLAGIVKKWVGQFKYTALVGPYIPNLEYIVNKDGGLNDLHIHLNGSTEIDVLWLHMLNHRHMIVKEYEKQFFHSQFVRKQSEQLIANFTPEMLKAMLSDASKIRVSLIREAERFYNYYGDLNCSMEGELLLNILIIKQLRNCGNEFLAASFHHYLLIKGLIQRFVVMQNSQVGFSQFKLITDNSFRWNAERYYKQRFLQLAGPLSQCVVNRIEGRFSPKLSVIENRKLIKRIVDGFKDAQKDNTQLLGNTELILIAHFIKKPENNKDKEYAIRHYFLRKELKKKAFSLLKIIRNNPNGLGNYVKGVDAAASEFDAGPEVFAPTFRFLRETGIQHITYHVGEDFRHLLSGLRTVYEALFFLEMKSGDRLGHCTALGIDPILWRNRSGKAVYVRRGEWLDDLVFVWYLIKQSLNKDLQFLVLQLESEIKRLSKEIYGNVYQPNDLANAWLLRKNAIIPELDSFCPVGSLHYYDTLIKIETIKNSPEGKIWQEYHEPLRYVRKGNRREPVGCRSNYDEIIKVETDLLFDVDSLRMIQILVLECLTEKNVVIEALPSSNLHISLYKDLKEYHLMRWVDSDRKECLMPSVVLGSDDPGIFMTNIYNEYSMAYLHFGLNKCPISKRLEYIRHIKEFSEIYGFHNG